MTPKARFSGSSPRTSERVASPGLRPVPTSDRPRPAHDRFRCRNTRRPEAMATWPAGGADGLRGAGGRRPGSPSPVRTEDHMTATSYPRPSTASWLGPDYSACGCMTRGALRQLCSPLRSRWTLEIGPQRATSAPSACAVSDRAPTSRPSDSAHARARSHKMFRRHSGLVTAVRSGGEARVGEPRSRRGCRT